MDKCNRQWQLIQRKYCPSFYLHAHTIAFFSTSLHKEEFYTSERMLAWHQIWMLGKQILTRCQTNLCCAFVLSLLTLSKNIFNVYFISVFSCFVKRINLYNVGWHFFKLSLLWSIFCVHLLNLLSLARLFTFTRQFGPIIWLSLIWDFGFPG